MRLRQVRHALRTIVRIPKTLCTERSTAPPFSHAVRHLNGVRPAKLATDSHRRSKDDKHGSDATAKCGGIRPLTLFAICIPLGYALSWAWRKQKEDNGGAGQDGFLRYSLADKEDVSSTCSIFTLHPATTSMLDQNISKRAITSVQFKQPQLQIARSYTLLPPTEDQDVHDLRFLIRKERKGEVSGYLHKLPLGADIEVRGPCVEYVLPEDVSAVLFLAGGTGIVPALQVANGLAEQADVRILWANRHREDCIGGKSDTVTKQRSLWGSLLGYLRPAGHTSSNVEMQYPGDSPETGQIVSLLQKLQAIPTTGTHPPGYRWLWVDYYVDEEGTFIDRGAVSRLTATKGQGTSSNGKKLLLVSGPEGFVNHWAGPKQWINGREVQGPLGGMLRDLDLGGWEVIKL